MSSWDIAFFGSSLVSAYWNGAATYYRGIIRALHARGHRITFYEPDAWDRQKHRDIPAPSWCDVFVYSGIDSGDVERALDDARRADVVIKASGVGVWDDLLEEAVPRMKRPGAMAIFWDVDAPATLARLRHCRSDPLARALRTYDAVLTYGGGEPVTSAYRALGATQCAAIYNAVDPTTHFRVSPDARFAADLAFLANRLPDRERRADEFFFGPASVLPDRHFLLGGNGWDDKVASPNVVKVGHVYTADHNALNSTALAVLNVARDSMAEVGWSPATRVFEAAGAGACIITDAWRGIEDFLEPGREVLVAHDGHAVAQILHDLTPQRARAVGEAARARVLEEHTYDVRAKEVEELLSRGMGVRREPLSA